MIITSFKYALIFIECKIAETEETERKNDFESKCKFRSKV